MSKTLYLDQLTYSWKPQVQMHYFPFILNSVNVYRIVGQESQVDRIKRQNGNLKLSLNTCLRKGYYCHLDVFEMHFIYRGEDQIEVKRIEKNYLDNQGYDDEYQTWPR